MKIFRCRRTGLALGAALDARRSFFLVGWCSLSLGHVFRSRARRASASGRGDASPLATIGDPRAVARVINDPARFFRRKQTLHPRTHVRPRERAAGGGRRQRSRRPSVEQQHTPGVGIKEEEELITKRRKNSCQTPPPLSLSHARAPPPITQHDKRTPGSRPHPPTRRARRSLSRHSAPKLGGGRLSSSLLFLFSHAPRFQGLIV